MPKHIPMLLDQEMVAALVGGRKTQMRRAIRFPVKFSERVGFRFQDKKGVWWACGVGATQQDTMKNFIASKSPYQVGDLIWVREKFRIKENTHNDLKGQYCICYPSTEECRLINPDYDNNDHLAYAILKNHDSPSIHMPKYASRLTLKVTSVSIERVQDISDAQAIMEGMPSEQDAKAMAIKADMSWYQKPHIWFKHYWERLHKNWGENPYTWCITFDVIKKNISELAE